VETLTAGLPELASLLAIVKVVFGFGAVIFIHEFGHFLMARRNGVFVEKFAIGFDFFGAKLATWHRGGTEYVVGAFPLGGYVKMKGQHDIPGDEESAAFFVSGLGLTPLSKNQSAAHLIRKVPFNKMIEKPVEALGGLAARLFREGVLHEVWINLTDAPETSAFTTRAERISVKTWAARAHQRHAAGRGRSARSLFER